MSTYVVFTLECTVSDEEDLYEAALKHAVEIDCMSRDEAVAVLRDEDGVKVTDCVQMLLDPGSCAGIEIEHSSAELVDLGDHD